MDEDLGFAIAPRCEGRRQDEGRPGGAKLPDGLHRRRGPSGDAVRESQVTTKPCGSVDDGPGEDEVSRIDRLAVDLDFVVEVGTGRDAGLADLGDLVAPCDRIPDAHQNP